jgi:hypothetical protein
MLASPRVSQRGAGIRAHLGAVRRRIQRRLPRSVSLFVAVLGVGLIAASPASAANVAPNPGFETDCAGIPCSWGGELGVTAARDTTAAHSGAASMRVTQANVAPNPGFETNCTGIPCSWDAQPAVTVARDTTAAHAGAASLKVTTTSTLIGAFSTCVTVGPGTFDAAFWYLTTNANATSARLFVNWLSSNDCSSGSLASTEIFSNSLVIDPNWHQVTGTMTAPAGTQSARLFLLVGCSTCTGGVAVNFDDVELGPTTTAAGLSSFSAHRTSRGVAIRWRSSAETRTVGFNVYRQRHGRLAKLNQALIPANSAGTTMGDWYSWVDRSAPTQAATYRLQAVGLNGMRSWIGTAVVAR